MPYLNPLDPATPADGNFLREGDDRIREAKAALIERLLTVFTNLDLDPLVFINGVIPRAALGALGIGTADIVDLAITTLKLADLAVTDAKIANVDGGKITDNTIANSKIQDLAITLAKLADSSVGTAKVVDLAITAIKIALKTITAAQIADDTLTDSLLAPSLRLNLIKQAHVDVNVLAFTLATDTPVDTGSNALGGVLPTDNIIVTPDGAAAAVFTAAQKLMQWYGFSDAPGTVKIRFINTSGGPITMPTLNWRVMALRRYSDWYP